jgi:hypothetical protein
MRTLLVLALSLVVAFVHASSACDVFKMVARIGVLSYEENKVLVRKEIKGSVKKHKLRFGAQTMMMFPFFNIYAAPYLNVPSLKHMPSTWIAVPGVGPNSASMPIPRRFKSNNQAALTCQFDCLSKVNGRSAYTRCQYRYYTYAAYQVTEGCFSRKIISDQQAALVNQICTSHNRCVGSNWAVTKENIAISVGDNTPFVAPLGISK